MRAQVWLWDNSASAYIDRSFSSEYQVLTDVDDRLYVGLDRRFDAVNFALSLGGTYTGVTLEYWHGTDWTGFGLTYALAATDFISWNIREDLRDWTPYAFSLSAPHAGTPPDNRERYWLRIKCTAVTTAATISSLSINGYTTYATARDVSNFLQQATGETFDLTTLPTEHTVEDVIRRHESALEKITRKSWRSTEITELHEFNYAGIRVVKPPLKELKQVRLWQGTSWRVLEMGRTGECYAVEEQSMVFFTRFFVPIFVPYSGGGAIMPFVYLYMMRYPVEITYQRGFDFSSHEEAGLVEHTIILMAAISLMQEFERSILTKAGVDRIEMSARVRFWKDEVEDNLATLATGLTIF